MRYASFKELKSDVQSNNIVTTSVNNHKKQSEELEAFLKLIRKELLAKKKAQKNKIIHGGKFSG